ncbi:hypothetical protein [Bifidobacterium gallicum]|uniref:Putative riboflavin-specific deaminase n=1 Tax=Bifidobacterium gallicum DSM 20093 = LMG 11596 TaxID=561180 RepID=A0A087AKT5_9BIFI|nr:hypothetical protein [Bifidobacterium gallicum]KFI59385.1 putative riboflavin-specific deaminase [Bifidobacterium gallicum DSM 20093 = LMG 11596]
MSQTTMQQTGATTYAVLIDQLRQRFEAVLCTQMCEQRTGRHAAMDDGQADEGGAREAGVHTDCARHAAAVEEVEAFGPITQLPLADEESIGREAERLLQELERIRHGAGRASSAKHGGKHRAKRQGKHQATPQNAHQDVHQEGHQGQSEPASHDAQPVDGSPADMRHGQTTHDAPEDRQSEHDEFAGIPVVVGYRRPWGFDAMALVQTGLVDEQLMRLGFDAFGASHWVDTMLLATLTRDRNLIALVRRFLSKASLMTSTGGLCVWLYDVLNDANISAMLHQPSANMPIMRPMGIADIGIQLRKQTLNSARQRPARGVASDALIEDMWRYAEECNRLAIYVLTCWGSGDDSIPYELRTLHLDVACMLASHPHIGMAMMREDERVGRRADPDTRYRRVVDYVGALRLEADLDYVRINGTVGLDGFSPRDSLQGIADRMMRESMRFVDDGQRLLDALGELWDEFVDDPGELLLALEERNAKPQQALWKNPVHLAETAGRLLGPGAGERLMQAFEQHDLVAFEQMADLLRIRLDMVERMGLLEMMSAMVHRSQAMLAHAGDTRLVFRNTLCEQYRDLAYDLAGVLLLRMPDSAWLRDMAVALMRGDDAMFDHMLNQLPQPAVMMCVKGRSGDSFDAAHSPIAQPSAPFGPVDEAEETPYDVVAFVDDDDDERDNHDRMFARERNGEQDWGVVG